MLIARFVLIILFACTPYVALAADGPDPSELLQVKTTLEEAVAKKYRERISTRIPSELFNVGAQVTVEPVVEKPAQNAVANAAPSAKQDLPSDLSLGIMAALSGSSSDPGLAGAPTLAAQLRAHFKITRVEVFVGLSAKLGEPYKGTLRTWLKTNVKSEFGALGTATISDLAPIPKDEERKVEPPAPRVLTWEERFGNFQNLAGLSVVAIIVFVIFLLSKLLPSRDAKDQAANNLRIEEMKLAQAASESQKQVAVAKKDNKKPEQVLNANLLFDSYRDHQKKTAFIALSSVEQLDQAIDLWFEEGEAGRRKLASVLDCVLTQVGIARFSGQSQEPTSAHWEMPEKIKNDALLPAVFRSFSELTLQEKSEIQEKAYWDLLSVKTLGERTLKQRFSSLLQMNPAAIQKFLSGQDVQVRSVAVLHLPIEKMAEVVSGMTFEEKKSLIDHALESPKLAERDLESVDRSVASLVKLENIKETGLIDFAAMIPNLLMVMPPTEEVRVLKEIVAVHPDAGLVLKTSYPSIAYLGEWKTEKLKLLVGRLKSNETLALLQFMPELKERVIAQLPSRTKAILTDEMGRRILSVDEINQNLEEVRAHLFTLVDSGELTLAQAFEPAATTSRKAA